MAYVSLLVLVSAAFIFSFVVISSSFRRRQPPKGTQYPPGPPGKPFVGNLLEIPPKHSWLKFKEWSDQHGPLFRMNIAGRDHYVASTEKVANDLLRERGTIYSSREQLPGAVTLLSDNLRPLFWPYGDTWREGRKLMHQVTNITVVAKYESTQILESARTLYDLIKEPSKYEHWFERYSSGIIFRLAFGKTIQTGDEDSVQEIINTVHTVERVASPGAYLVDTFPAMLSLPTAIAPFKQELGALHARELKLFRKLLNDVKSEMKAGTAPDCWFRDYLERNEEYKLSEDQGAYVIGTLFEAGAGTTAAAMMSFMLCILHHPTWLDRLQTEVDSVCTDSRLPTLADVPQLPTVRAVVKEVLRWRPVTAGNVPHLSTKDDTYNGMFIPANTIVHANQWAIHRDPTLYPHPEDFKPERWLDPAYPTTYREPLSQYPNMHNFSAFGFGRRICPGQNMAERSLYLLVSRIAWACNVTLKKGPDGRDILPPLYDYTEGFNVQPNFFPFDLTPRSDARVRVLEREMEENHRADVLKGR